jgi:hypothetical protein
MIANINKEYSAPNTAKCKANAERIERQTKAFLAKGGSIETVANKTEITAANIKMKAKQKAARKRGLIKTRARR